MLHIKQWTGFLQQVKTETVPGLPYSNHFLYARLVLIQEILAQNSRSTCTISLYT